MVAVASRRQRCFQAIAIDHGRVVRRLGTIVGRWHWVEIFSVASFDFDEASSVVVVLVEAMLAANAYYREADMVAAVYSVALWRGLLQSGTIRPVGYSFAGDCMVERFARSDEVFVSYQQT